MHITFYCTKCGHKLWAAPDQAGKPCLCTRCQHHMTIPGASARRPRKRSRFLLKALVVLCILLAAGGGVAYYLTRPPGVHQYLADLKSGPPDARARAVVWLAGADPEDKYRPQVTAALEPLVFEGDPNGAVEPGEALRAYLHWADANNVPALIRLVEGPPALRHGGHRKTELVLQTLGKLQDPRAVDVLVSQLSSPKLHDEAKAALKVLGPQAAETAVLACYFDADPAVRQRAKDLLDYYHTRPGMFAVAAIDRLRSRNPEVQHLAAEWCAENVPDDEARQAEGAKLLVRLLDDLSPKVNALGLRALKLWATKDTVPEVVAFAQRQVKAAPGSEAAANSKLLIEVLAQYPDPAAAEALASFLRDPAQRALAAQALQKLGPASVDAVLSCLNHPDPDVGKEARRLARALGIPEDRQIDQTIADVADPRKQRSRTALEHLAALRPDEARRPKVSQALNAALLDPDRGIREAAVHALKVWASKENTGPLVKLLGSFQGGPKEDVHLIDKVSLALIAIGPGVEDSVIPLLESPENVVRSQACRVLAEVGTEKSVRPLRQAGQRYGGEELFVTETRMAIAKIQSRQ